MSVIAERLQDAIEKGDVAELEVAITAAQAALEDGLYRGGSSRGSGTGSLAALLSKAKDVFLNNLEDCRTYLKPLRKACRQLEERAIFDALVRTQSATERVQLHMYTDIRRAEELRGAIVAAHEHAAALLGSDDWHRIDAFLNDKASVLEDRTVLALVQRREDLLKSGRARSSSSQRVESDDCSPRQYNASASSNFLVRQEDPPRARLGLRPSPALRPFQNDDVPVVHRSVTPHRASAASTASDGIVQSPLSFRPLIDTEASQRAARQLEEEAARVTVYKAAIRGVVEVAVPPRKKFGSGDGAGPFQDEWLGGMNLRPGHGVPREPAAGAHQQHRQPQRTVRDTTAPPSDDGSDSSGNDNDNTDAGPAPRRTVPLASMSPLERENARPQWSHSPPGREDTPLRSRHNRITDTHQSTASADAGISRDASPAARRRPAADDALRRLDLGPLLRTAVGKGTAAPEGAAGRPPRNGSREQGTPNLSPIRDPNTTLLSDREGHPTGGLGRVLSRRGGEPVDGSVAAAVVSRGTPMRSYELRRVEVLLRGALEEEDLYRRDIEGSEDFDRCVFLHPVVARIDMLIRAKRDRQRALAY